MPNNVTQQSDRKRRAHRRLVGGAWLVGLAGTAALACAKGDNAANTADSTVAATATADSSAVAAGTVASADSNTQKTSAETPPAEVAKLDTATRIAARQGAGTRDTAKTGAVTPPPKVRKTADSAAARPAPKPAATRTAAKPAADTASAPKATTSSAGGANASTSSMGSTRDTASSNTRSSGAGQASGAAGGGAAPAGASGDPLLVSQQEYQGWKTFHVYCYRCHGVDAMGSDLAPNLRHSLGPQGSVTHEVFVTTVKEGRLAKGMPTWKALLDDQQIEQLYAYIKARSSGRLAPGRPHTAK